MTEFSPKAIEQLNQTVREVSRRVRNEAPPRARWQKRKAPAATGGSGGGGLATNNCCDTIYQAGSVDLDGLEWATDYTITLAAPIGTVTVTDQGSGTWESDVVEVTCTVDEVTVTDEYTVTMTATGNAPGEVIVTVALTLGGGYGGAAGCCETTEAGFAWKYVNCCIVDPLAGWSMTRDPSGFSGKECGLGGCEICVTPRLGGITAACLDPASIVTPDIYMPSSWNAFVFGAAGKTDPSGVSCPWYDDGATCTAHPEYLGIYYRKPLVEPSQPPDPSYSGSGDPYELELVGGRAGTNLNKTHAVDAIGASLHTYNQFCTTSLVSTIAWTGGGSNLCYQWRSNTADTTAAVPGSPNLDITKHGNVAVYLATKSVTVASVDYVLYSLQVNVLFPGTGGVCAVYKDEKQWTQAEFSKTEAESWLFQSRTLTACASVDGLYTQTGDLAIPQITITPAV